MLARVGIIVMALSALLIASPAAAQAKHESPYTYKQTFSTAVRLLRVDLELEVTETDAEYGYLMFIYTSPESGKRKNRGSITFVEEEEGVRVNLQIPEMPSYHEQIIIDKLARKLENEYGDPPPRKKKKPKDDDDDEDKDKDKKDKDDNAPIQPDQGPPKN